MVVDSLVSAEKAIFRTNRDVIVLNDIEKDGLWLPDSDMILVDNWDQLESKLESEKETEDQSVDDIDNTVAPDRNQDNTPPEAVDDDFGVRAGKTVILPVLMNDSDADGDFMTASALTQPSLGQVSVAREGAALQIAVNKDASGTSTFGLRGLGWAGRNRAGPRDADRPRRRRQRGTRAEDRALRLPGQGGRTTVNGLTNWVDPDGDPFFLAGATAPTGTTVNSHETATLKSSMPGTRPARTRSRSASPTGATRATARSTSPSRKAPMSRRSQTPTTSSCVKAHPRRSRRWPTTLTPTLTRSGSSPWTTCPPASPP